MSRPQVAIRHPSSSYRLMFYTMRGWKLQSWRLVPALPVASSNSGGPASHSLVMARCIIGGSCSYSTYSGGLTRVSSRRASTPNHFKGSLSLKGTPAIRTYFRCNGQYCLCHLYSIVEAVYLFSEVSQQLVVAFSLSLPFSLYLFSRRKKVFLLFTRKICPLTRKHCHFESRGESPSRQYF
ncbi:hypothetical protein AVEN_127511-1 [Araneus ventricosus]|uniref:Uncharacterized protein n=1 Tax=Araneus ventricosus TaxID=182803 RepID=A0A4Y2E1V0_ARAVE|nr:hypothetical protein AVEN_127511-1 [Araneus ventricosus]